MQIYKRTGCIIIPRTHRLRKVFRKRDKYTENGADLKRLLLNTHKRRLAFKPWKISSN